MLSNIKNKILEIYKKYYKKLENFFEKDFEKGAFKNVFISCKDLMDNNMFFEFLFNIVMVGAVYLVATNIHWIVTNIKMICYFLFFTVVFVSGVGELGFWYFRKKKKDKKNDKKNYKKNDK